MSGDKLQKELSAVDLQKAEEMIRSTRTPNLRLYVFTQLMVTLTQMVSDWLNSGRIKREVAVWWRTRAAHFKESAPSNFVSMIAEVHALLIQFNEEHAAEIEALPAHHAELFRRALPLLHEAAFSPPPGYLSDDSPERLKDLTNFVAFVQELNQETDRGAALVGAALVHDRLGLLLSSHFQNQKIAHELLSNSPNAPLASLSSRISASYALGLITEVEYAEATIIRRVRNDFAHRLHGLTFQDNRIGDRCRELKAFPYEFQGNPRQRFINSVVMLCLVLWYRPAHAACFSTREREWSWHLAFGK